MLDWLKKRFSEKSTYIGIATALVGAGQAFKVNEAVPVAEVVQAAGNVVGQGGGMVEAGLVAGLGILSVIMKERGR